MDKKQKDLAREFRANQKELIRAITRVLGSGRYILGKEVEAFEEEFAEYVGAKYCVGVNSGYGALYMSYLLYPKGKVYIHEEKHVATTNAAIAAGHEITFQTDYTILSIVQPVKEVMGFCMKRLHVVVDACQSLHLYPNKGGINFPTCFSFHPLKPLHCYGDGGAIVSNDEQIVKRLRRMRNHGRYESSDRYGFGVNCRLDEIQAAILRVYLNKLKKGH